MRRARVAVAALRNRSVLVLRTIYTPTEERIPVRYLGRDLDLSLLPVFKRVHTPVVV